MIAQARPSGVSVRACSRAGTYGRRRSGLRGGSAAHWEETRSKTILRFFLRLLARRHPLSLLLPRSPVSLLGLFYRERESGGLVAGDRLLLRLNLPREFRIFAFDDSRLGAPMPSFPDTPVFCTKDRSLEKKLGKIGIFDKCLGAETCFLSFSPVWRQSPFVPCRFIRSVQRLGSF